MINDIYYVFSFSSYHNIVNMNSNNAIQNKIMRFKGFYNVCTKDINNMILFLRQHGFDDSCFDNVLTCSEELIDNDAIILDESLLGTYKLQSNITNKTYSIMTTRGILNKLIDMFIVDYAKMMTFGPAINRDDIEVLDVVCQLLYKIPYTQIFERCISGDQAIKNINRFGEKEDGYSVTPDDEYEHYEFISDIIYNTSGYDELVFTVESYSKYFAEEMYWNK